MAVKCFLKHGLPFQYDLIASMPEMINIKKLRVVDQRFRLRFMPLKKGYARVARI